MKKRLFCLLLAALIGTFSAMPVGAVYNRKTTESGVTDVQADPPETEEAVEPEPVSGWVQDELGSWRLYKEGMALTGWQLDNNKWYYLGADGVMLDGWQKINGRWYLLRGGAMQTGWQMSGGKWYYLDPDSGAMKTGWLDVNGKRYYLTGTGAMKTGFMTEGSTVYTLDSSGAVASSKNLSSLSNKSYGWGQGTQTDALNRPVSAVSYQSQFGELGGVFIGPNEKTIYLTFDEGYENGYTAAILDTLKAKGVTATFFITGDYLNKQPELVQRMIDEGHTVGNHTVNHPNLTKIGISARSDELGGLHEQMEQRFGYTMHLMRPPEGVFSEQILAQAQGMGYQTVLWSFAYKDWDPSNQMATSTAYQKATAALHPGAVYLLHAVSKTNAAILGDFIDEVRRQGYAFGVLE